MTYCTRQDLVDEFGATELIQLTDDDNIGVIDDIGLNRSIARADRTINRYLGGRQVLPVSSDDVVDIACDLTRYFLYDDHVPNHIRTRYEDAIAQLKSMAKGEIGVVDSAGDVAESSDGAQIESGGRVFSRNDNGFI